jgi:hypothetical protein
MTEPEISLNIGKDIQKEVVQAHYDLERTQPVDQLEEGRKCDRRVAKDAARASAKDSSKSKRR